MPEGGAIIARELQDLLDQVLQLTLVQWGFVAVTAAAAFVWVWVMGAPGGERRPALAGALAALAGLAATLALALLGPHRFA